MQTINECMLLLLFNKTGPTISPSNTTTAKILKEITNNSQECKVTDSPMTYIMITWEVCPVEAIDYKSSSFVNNFTQHTAMEKNPVFEFPDQPSMAEVSEGTARGNARLKHTSGKKVPSRTCALATFAGSGRSDCHYCVQTNNNWV